jgi:hypothetical protein
MKEEWRPARLFVPVAPDGDEGLSGWRGERGGFPLFTLKCVRVKIAPRGVLASQVEPP